jgi:hypothetical protein
MKPLVNKILRAAKLDANLYVELMEQPEAISEALTVIVLASLAAGIGAIGRTGISGIVVSGLGAFIDWFLWAFIVYFLSIKYLTSNTESVSQVDFIRTIGFASAPGLIRILGIISPLYILVNIISNIWMLTSMTVATKNLYKSENDLTLVKICAGGWVLMVIAALILGSAAKGIGF